jgi:pantoate--beta-alanine ligase
MQVIRTVKAMREWSEGLRRQGKRIGVVPTMGFLHKGHTSLIEQTTDLADVVVTTIFVNPTQFGPNEDFERYPRDFDRDTALAAQAGSDIIFAPDVHEMYPEGFSTSVEIVDGSQTLEGKFRPTHFRGVTTVVAKLLNITKPHVAVFGQKDAQQVFLIQRMVRDLNLDVEIVIAPIVREADGLAMSSRNVYLNAMERRNAASLFQALLHAQNRIREGERSTASLSAQLEQILQDAKPTRIDYIAVVRPEIFQEVERIEPPRVLVALAARFGSTRLIDNILIDVPAAGPSQ